MSMAYALQNLSSMSCGRLRSTSLHTVDSWRSNPARAWLCTSAITCGCAFACACACVCTCVHAPASMRVCVDQLCTRAITCRPPPPDIRPGLGWLRLQPAVLPYRRDKRIRILTVLRYLLQTYCNRCAEAPGAPGARGAGCARAAREDGAKGSRGAPEPGQAQEPGQGGAAAAACPPAPTHRDDGAPGWVRVPVHACMRACVHGRTHAHTRARTHPHTQAPSAHACVQLLLAAACGRLLRCHAQAPMQHARLPPHLCPTQPPCHPALVSSRRMCGYSAMRARSGAAWHRRLCWRTMRPGAQAAAAVAVRACSVPCESSSRLRVSMGPELDICEVCRTPPRNEPLGVCPTPPLRRYCSYNEDKLYSSCSVPEEVSGPLGPLGRASARAARALLCPFMLCIPPPHTPARLPARRRTTRPKRLSWHPPTPFMRTSSQGAQLEQQVQLVQQQQQQQ